MGAMNDTTTPPTKRTRIKNLPLPPLGHLRECFSYEPETGILRWNPRPLSHFDNEWRFTWWNVRFAGKEAGSKQRGVGGHPSCIRVKLQTSPEEESVHYVAHRIVLALTGKEVPDGMVIDHKNGNPWDNRLDNLEVTTYQNNNLRRIQNRNKMGGFPLGIRKVGNRYTATIKLNEKLLWIGAFSSLEEAVEARRKKQIELYGGDSIRE